MLHITVCNEQLGGLFLTVVNLVLRRGCASIYIHVYVQSRTYKALTSIL